MGNKGKKIFRKENFSVTVQTIGKEKYCLREEEQLVLLR
jgi:hypothetical protein